MLMAAGPHPLSLPLGEALVPESPHLPIMSSMSSMMQVLTVA